MSLIRSHFCTFILLFFSFSHTFCATNAQQEQAQLSKKGLLAKLTWKKAALGSVIAICLYLATQQKDLRRSVQNLFGSKKWHWINYIDQQKAAERQKKKQAQYNKEAEEMCNDFLLMFLEKYTINQILFKEFLQFPYYDRAKFVENLRDLKIYHDQKLIESMNDTEKIKLFCLLHYFADQTNGYCQKIAGITEETFGPDFDFYVHKNEWPIPTNDEIFRYIPQLISVNSQNEICFGTKKYRFKINDVDSVLNLLVGSLVDDENGSSISGLMCAIYISLLNHNTVDSVTSLYMPKLKKLLEDGYGLSDTEKERWFVHIFFKLLDSINKNQDRFKAVLEILNCFYPTEFLLSEECLMGSGYSTFCRIGYKMWGTFNNYYRLKPEFENKEKDIEILYHMLPILERAYTPDKQTIFDFLFTPENLSEQWLQDLLEKEGIIHADVIWRGLKGKSEEEQNIILNTIDGTLKETILLFEEPEDMISTSSDISISISGSFDYDNHVQQTFDLFFTSPDRFSQLFYTLLKNRKNFSHYMSNLFELENLFNLENNLFLSFVQDRFVDQNQEDQTPIGFVFSHLFDPKFLRDTTPGMMIVSITEQKENIKSIITQYTATRTNTLLLFTWYNLYAAIDLYENSHEQYPERVGNKDYLAGAFKMFLRPYRFDTSSIVQLEDNVKEKVCDGNDDIINVAKAYHLFDHVMEQSLYNMSKKEEFKKTNQGWIRENELCRYIGNEIYDMGILIQ